MSLALAASACEQPIELVWRHDLGAASESNPLVTDGYVAVGTELGLALVDLDGKRRCFFDAHGEVISAPRTDGTLIFFGSTNYNFYAVRPDCTEAWKFPTRDRIKSDPWVDVAQGRVFLSSYDGHVYALRISDGSRLWTFPAPAPAPDATVTAAAPADPVPPPAVGDFSYSSPVLHQGVLYLGNLDGRLYALDAATGALRWTFGTDGPITSTPRIEGNTIYFGSNDGSVYAVDLSTRERRWKFTTRDWVNSSAGLANATVYVGSNDRHVYALDAHSGEQVWRFDTAGPAVSSPLPYQNLVLAAGGSGDGAVYALQAGDGSLFWRYRTGGKISSDPVVAGDRLYVSSSDRHLYCFRIVRTAGGKGG